MTEIWQTPPQKLTLEKTDVHIWCVKLNHPQDQIEQLAKLLSEEEINRANRFHFEHHRHRFIIARSTLRIILGRYLNLKPEEIKFDYTPKGKPSIIESKGLEFNMSHSETLALYGLTRDRPIGVDIEHLRPMDDAASLAKRFFCQSESEAISGLSPGEIEKSFFRAWTAKEAFLKATGEGIAGGLDRIEVDLSSPDSLKFISINNNSCEVNQWTLLPLSPAVDYLGAIVVPGKIVNQQFLKIYPWSELLE